MPRCICHYILLFCPCWIHHKVDVKECICAASPLLWDSLAAGHVEACCMLRSSANHEQSQPRINNSSKFVSSERFDRVDCACRMQRWRRGFFDCHLSPQSRNATTTPGLPQAAGCFCPLKPSAWKLHTSYSNGLRLAQPQLTGSSSMMSLAC